MKFLTTLLFTVFLGLSSFAQEVKEYEGAPTTPARSATEAVAAADGVKEGYCETCMKNAARRYSGPDLGDDTVARKGNNGDGNRGAKDGQQ